MLNSFTKLSSGQAAARKRIEPFLDKYTHFSWRNEDAWTKFGAFIIADKIGDLEFHRGADFSNEYSKPQFGDTTGDLLGVTFDSFSITLNIGAYYISEDEYRRFLAWFSPYEISWLSFGYDEKWAYQCKISKISKVNRYVVGCVGNEDYYYAETSVTFEVVGRQNAYSKAPFEFTRTSSVDSSGMVNNDSICIKSKNTDDKDNSTAYADLMDTPYSDLDFPLEVSLSLNLNNLLAGAADGDKNTISVSCFTHLESSVSDRGEGVNVIERDYPLFSLVLNNVTADTECTYWFNIKYLSDSGLILYQYGNSQEKLLMLQNTVSSGKRFLQSISSKKFLWPGKFTSDVDYSSPSNHITFKISSSAKSSVEVVTPHMYANSDAYNLIQEDVCAIASAEGRAMTNVI